MGTVYWITGLPGSGKTTLGTMLYEWLKYQKHRKVVLLDGDQLRELLGMQQAHHIDERQNLSLTYARLCHFLAHQEIDVVCATVSLFHLVHNWNRQNMPHYCEILLQVPMEILMERDQKKLYSQAAQGKIKHVPGVDIQPQWPENPDLILINDGKYAPDIVFNEMLNKLRLL